MFEYVESPIISESNDLRDHPLMWFIGTVFLSIGCLSTGISYVFLSLTKGILQQYNLSEISLTIVLIIATVIFLSRLPYYYFSKMIRVYYLFFPGIIFSTLSYLILFFFAERNSQIFIAFIIILAFGNNLLFQSTKQIIIEQSPLQFINHSSTIFSVFSILSYAAMFGFYKLGDVIFPSTLTINFIGGMKSMCLNGFLLVIIFTLIGFILTRYSKSNRTPSTEDESWKEFSTFWGTISSFILVFDGMLVYEVGEHIWYLQSPNYTDAQAIWSLPFVLIQCILSKIIMKIVHYCYINKNTDYRRSYGICIIICAIFPLFIAISLGLFPNVVFGIAMSFIGVPFQLYYEFSALTFNKKQEAISNIGSSFAIILLGSVINTFDISNTKIILYVLAGLHLVIGGLWQLSPRRPDPSPFFDQIDVLFGDK